MLLDPETFEKSFFGLLACQNIGLDALYASIVCKGPKRAKPTIGQFLAGKLHHSAIFYFREAGKVSFPMFCDAASPKTVVLIDFHPI